MSVLLRGRVQLVPGLLQICCSTTDANLYRWICSSVGMCGMKGLWWIRNVSLTLTGGKLRLFLSSWRLKFNISDKTFCWMTLVQSGPADMFQWTGPRMVGGAETDLVMLRRQVIRYISWHLPPTCAFNKSFHNVYVNMQMCFMSPSLTRVRSVQKPRDQIMNHKLTADLQSVRTYLRLLNW